MNRHWILRGAAALAFCALFAGTAAAQVFTPTFMSPTRGSNVGIYFSDVDFGDFALEGIWRQSARTYDLGLRAGVVDVGDLSLTVGGEVRAPIVLAGAPIGLAFTAGGQAVVGDASGLGVQAGFTAGHTFRPEGANFTFTPYIHPRLALLNSLGGADEFDAEVLADLGFDLAFAPNLMFRFSAGLGDGPDWGLGVAWRR